MRKWSYGRDSWNKIMDTLRNIFKSPVGTVFEGTAGILVTLWDVLPEIIRILIGIATLAHIVVRIKKDLK